MHAQSPKSGITTTAQQETSLALGRGDSPSVQDTVKSCGDGYKFGDIPISLHVRLNPRIVGCYAYIVLADGRVATIDSADVGLVSGRRWHAVNKGGRWYVRSGNRMSGGLIMLHRLITGARSGQMVDHANGDGLDNRRTNLRICAPTENCRNTRKNSRGGTSAFKGVSKGTGLKKFRATIQVGRSRLHLGYFMDEELAAHAYDAAARQHFKEFARLNFPTTPSQVPA